MKKISSTLLPTLVGTIVLSGGVDSAFALSFTTTLTFSDPYVEMFSVTSAVYNWETNATSGNITSGDVTNLTLQLFGAGNSLLFTDAMIVNGVAQPIGGISRGIYGIIWNFDLSTSTLSSFDNDNGVVQQNFATGNTYNVYGSSNYFGADLYTNGNGVASYASGTVNQSTVAQTQAVPEPVTILGTLLAGGLGVALKKKQSSNA